MLDEIAGDHGGSLHGGGFVLDEIAGDHGGSLHGGGFVLDEIADHPHLVLLHSVQPQNF